MANLNIIGNGFDLFHGLTTSYYYFACYILSKDEQLYDDLVEMYGFRRGILHHFSDKLDRGIDNIGYWCEFEKNLGNLSSQWVENSLVDDLGLEYPDAVDLEVDRPNHVELIKEMLKEWISTIVDIQQNFEIVKEMIGTKKMNFSDEDLFISFNYTHTLEEIYSVHNVLHIHGESDLSMHKDLIIGHGNSTEIENLESKIKELDIDDYDQPSRNRKLEYQFEKDILEDLRKPVGKCITKLISFLDSVEKPDNICVYGFSLGSVDAPYIQFIKNKWPDCNWRFSFYSESDKSNIEKTAKYLGLEGEKYEMFEFKNTEASKIEEKLIKENEIKTFPTL